MKRLLILLVFNFILVQVSVSAEQGQDKAVLKELSALKWQWMAAKDTDKLEILFHDDAKFVHMSGTWKKQEELDIIASGRIWYKNAEVHDVAVEVFNETAVVWNRITLEAEVRGKLVSNEFTVTEVYQKNQSAWEMLGLTFSSVRDTHEITH